MDLLSKVEEASKANNGEKRDRKIKEEVEKQKYYDEVSFIGK